MIDEYEFADKVIELLKDVPDWLCNDALSVMLRKAEDDSLLSVDMDAIKTKGTAEGFFSDSYKEGWNEAVDEMERNIPPQM